MTKKDSDKQSYPYHTDGQHHGHSSPPASDPFQQQSGGPFQQGGSPFQQASGPFEQGGSPFSTGSPFQTGGAFQAGSDDHDFGSTPESATALFSAELFGDLDISTATDNAPIEVQQPVLELEQKLPDRTRTAPKAAMTQHLSVPPPIPKPPSSAGKIVLVLLLLVVIGGGGTAAAYFLGFFDAGPAPIVRRTVHISSTPAGALIWINDKKMPQATPIALKLVVGRKYKVRLEAKDHRPQASLLVIKDLGEKVTQKAKYVLVKLPPPAVRPNIPVDPRVPPKTDVFGSLEILCKTEGAQIDVKLETAPSTPLPLPDMICRREALKVKLAPGKYSLVTSKEGFEKDERTIEVIAEQAQTLSIELQKETRRRRKRRRKTGPAKRRGGIVRVRGAAEITINSNLPGTIVRWRGKKLGKLPLTYRFPAGPQTIMVEHPKLFSRVSKTFTVVPKTNATIPVNFKKGRIKFIIHPWADVHINGKKIGQTPIATYKAWPGVYTILLKKGDLSETKLINLKPGGTSTVRHTFN
ncbi:MAG: PEGA domain-containing protein [Myxococcales bacterium]|nr:PEGA domain-containing protein [Myxococcales bacterium]